MERINIMINWQRRTAVYGLTILLLALLIGCGGRESAAVNDTGVVVTATAGATAVGDTTLDVMLTDANGQPVTEAVVQVRGDMSHAGMTPVLRTAVAGQPGLYHAPFTWTMGGDWVVTVEFTLPDGRIGRETFPFTIAN
jgi:hypothetical protein